MSTQPQSQTEWDDGRKRVVIIGGGFAGVSTARQLERSLDDTWDIFLLSKANVITYNPLLPEVVGASLLPGHAVAPLRHILKRTRMRMVNITKIDLAEHFVEYDAPIIDRIRYDQLVIAAGLTARMDVVPGMAQHGLALKTLGDALHLRNRVIGRLEAATLNYDPQAAKELTSFVVAGGGFSGVEAAGEISDLLTAGAPYFKRVTTGDCQVHLVHSRDTLLPEVSTSLGRYAQRLMERRGIQVHLNARVARVESNGVALDSGVVIPANTIVNTVGTEPHPFLAALAVANERGRIQVTPHLNTEQYDNVWALGDCAEVPNQATQNPCPTTAQFAVKQAHHLAANLKGHLSGQPLLPFSYVAKGQMAAIGHRKAVAEIYGVRLSGLMAWFAWRAFYLARIPTLARKVRLFLEWNWSLLFPKDIAQLDFSRTRKAEDQR